MSRIIIIPLLIIMILSSVFLCWSARKNKVGMLLLAVNLSLFLFALILILKTDYTLIGLMLIRILHDVSGFIVYIKHDCIRNKQQRNNFVYRPFNAIPIWLLNPLLAVIVAGILTKLSSNFQFVGWLVVGLTAAHYYMESIIWRGGTLHRQQVNMRVENTALI